MTPEEITKALSEINNPDLADIINKIQLNTLLAKGAGTGMTVGTWLALSVGAGSILAWMRRL